MWQQSDFFTVRHCNTPPDPAAKPFVQLFLNQNSPVNCPNAKMKDRKQAADDLFTFASCFMTSQNRLQDFKIEFSLCPLQMVFVLIRRRLNF